MSIVQKKKSAEQCRESAKERYGYIGLLRVIAMFMVLMTHLLAYRIDTIQMRYLAHYVLNPLHIIQFCGALGVSIFFITSGYLSMAQIGTKHYFRRFYRSVVVMMAETFAAILFSCVFVTTFECVFQSVGFVSTYSNYSIRDWLESAVLYRNFMFYESTEAVLWFLIPFLFFKVILLLGDLVFSGDAKKSIYLFYGIFLIGWTGSKLNYDICVFTERFFYVSIILFGCIFALKQSGKINIKELLILLLINVINMLAGIAGTSKGIDDGYIVSVFYAAMLFYLFWKMRGSIKYNGFISLSDRIGLPFYLLHNNVGWVLIQYFYYVIFHETHAWLSLFIAVLCDLIIIVVYTYTIQKLIHRSLNILYIKGSTLMTQAVTRTIEIPQNRKNNFAMLRFIAALMVMAGHMGYIAGAPVPTLFGRQIHAVGVYIFFLLGGYLITKSWLSDPNPLRYGIKRFLRIWPPFAVCVLLTVYIIGPMLSTMGREGYFSSWYTSYLTNLRMCIVYALPGAFTDNPYPNTVNGCFWTLPVEVAMYIAVPILLTVVHIWKNKRRAGQILIAIAICVCCLDCWTVQKAEMPSVVFYGTNWVDALHIIPFYLIGMVFAYCDLKKCLNLQAAIVAMLLLSCFELPYVPQQIALYVLLPILVFSIGLQKEPAFAGFCSHGEISYGMYLYGFLIQQTIVYICLRNEIYIGYNMYFTITVLITIIVAKLSSLLVEKPVQRFSMYCVSRLTKATSRNGNRMV